MNGDVSRSDEDEGPSQDDFVAALLDAQMSAPRGLSAPDGRAAGKRFDVYRNNVVAGLIASVGQAFPACRKLLGERSFGPMAAAFVRAHPPRSPVMLAYGAALPEWLVRDFAPAARVRGLADLARLELARREAYHAADAPALDAAAFQAAIADKPQEAVAAARLETHPGMRLVGSRWPIFTVWAALQEAQIDQRRLLSLLATDAGGHPGGDACGPGETALILRPSLELSMRAASPGAAAFLSAARERATIAEAAAAGAAAESGFELSLALGGALGGGAFTKLWV